MEEYSPRKLSKQFIEEPSPLSFVLRRLQQPENQYLPVPNTRLIFYPSITPQSHSSLVSFNNDHNPYTPAFVDGVGKQETLMRECDFKKLFEAQILKKKDSKPKTNDSSSKKPNLIKPEPNSKYCLVCKEPFNNYFTHISHPIHLKRIAQSQATQYIEELVDFVSSRKKKEGRQKMSRSQYTKKYVWVEVDLSVFHKLRCQKNCLKGPALHYFNQCDKNVRKRVDSNESVFLHNAKPYHFLKNI